MAPQKRKSPKGKGRAKRRQPGLASRATAVAGSLGLRGAGALGGLGLRGAGMFGTVIARHPSLAGGTAAFLVIFSFVAANALWYQPGSHPSPFMRTRDPGAPNAIAGRKFISSWQDPADVTTFRIERPQDGVATPKAPASQAAVQTAANAGQQAASAARPVSLKAGDRSGLAIPAVRPPEDVHSASASADPVAAAILSAEKDVKTASSPKKPPTDPVNNVNLVMQIQKGLANIAYSGVSVDGVVGEQTKTAILHFQKHYRLPETGEADPAVLKKLREIGAL